MLRTLLIDDEKPCLNRLDMLLRHYCPTTVQVAGHCQTVEAALLAIETHQPDLIFLDVQLGPKTGFDLLGGVPMINFDVVFSTAYDTYALRAFQADAVDYLLKPIDPDKLVKAVRKVQARSPQARIEYHQLLSQTIDHHEHKVGRVGIPTGNGRVYIAIQDIVYCQSQNGCLNLYGLQIKGAKNVLGKLSHSLDEFEESLNDPTFCRIHDGHLINLTYLKEYINGRGGQVIMTDGTELDVSDRRKADFKRRTQPGSF